MGNGSDRSNHHKLALASFSSLEYTPSNTFFFPPSCTQDGLLCCSYNFHCGDDALAVGYHAMASTVDRNAAARVSGGKTENSNVTRQYSATNISVSAGSNKTDGRERN